MLKPGSAKKVTIYVGEDVRHRGEPIYIVLLNYLFYHGVSGATVTKGVAGFGADHHMRTLRILEASENLPIKIEFVERPSKLDELLPKLLQMVGEGLVEIQDTTILKAGTPSEGEPPMPRVALRGKATLMRILIGEDDRWHGKRLYEAIVEALRATDI
ncbi:MAG TPA: DUF190 domain-containing protein, partial [Vicinamibacterales bacterium]